MRHLDVQRCANRSPAGMTEPAPTVETGDYPRPLPSVNESATFPQRLRPVAAADGES
jgi:hypothetical protein